MEILQNINYLWLIAGVALVLAEFMVVSGAGFLFAGLGALIVGLTLELGLAETLVAQIVIFLAGTLVSAVILWKPLAGFKLNKHQKPFSDMVGHKAVLIGALEPGQTGQARWSGTIMRAKLDGHAAALPDGAEVVIVRVEGNLLVVK